MNLVWARRKRVCFDILFLCYPKKNNPARRILLAVCLHSWVTALRYNSSWTNTRACNLNMKCIFIYIWHFKLDISCDWTENIINLLQPNQLKVNLNYWHVHIKLHDEKDQFSIPNRLLNFTWLCKTSAYFPAPETHYYPFQYTTSNIFLFYMMRWGGINFDRFWWHKLASFMSR